MTHPLHHHGLRPWAVTLLLSVAAAAVAMVGGNARAQSFADVASFSSRAGPWSEAAFEPGVPTGGSFASTIEHGGRTVWSNHARGGAWQASTWNHWPGRARGLYERDRTGVNVRTQLVGEGDQGAASLAAPVPEPETWAMMLLGVGGVWSATRRRKRPTRRETARRSRLRR